LFHTIWYYLIKNLSNNKNPNGIIIAPIGVLFQAAFGAVASIFNIQVLGNLTLGSIIIAPIAVALLWFILGIVSGVGVGGKKK
jgi:hypothetical protein